MILAWVALGVAVLAVAGSISSDTRPVDWPDEAPLNLHENRGEDPHLRHLARVLASSSVEEAHHAIADLTERLLDSGSVTLYSSSDAARARLGPEVARFLDQPPCDDPESYRRQLSAMLTRIEQL